MKLKINGEYYLYFNDFTMSSTLDSVASTFAFTVKFDPNNLVDRKLVRPLSFHKVEFFEDDRHKLLLTGTIVSQNFNSTSNPELVQLSGYSLGGVLEDCTIDYADYPLESLSRNLREISERLLKSFGLKLIVAENVKADCNHVYGKTVAKPEGTVKDYLSKLAAQRNVVMSHDEQGNIIYFRPDTKAVSKGFFDKDNTLNMGLQCNGQGMHSKITTIRQPSKASNDLFAEDSTAGVTGVDSVSNGLIKNHRPLVEVLTSGSDTDTSKGAKNTLASELKNIKWGFELSRWEDLKIGDVVEVENKEVYLYKRTRLMIESLSKVEDSAKKSMVVTLVLPETFTGEQPKQIFS